MHIPSFYCPECGKFKNIFQLCTRASLLGSDKTLCKKCDTQVWDSKAYLEKFMSEEYVTKHEFECFNTDPYIIDKLDKHIVSVVESMDRNSKQIVPTDLNFDQIVPTDLYAAIVALGSYATDKVKLSYHETQKATKILFSALSENSNLPYSTIALLKREIATIEDVIEKGPIDHDEPFK